MLVSTLSFEHKKSPNFRAFFNKYRYQLAGFNHQVL